MGRIEVARLGATNGRIDQDILNRSVRTVRGLPEHLLNPDQQAQDALLSEVREHGHSRHPPAHRRPPCHRGGRHARPSGRCRHRAGAEASIVDDAQQQKQLVVLLAALAVGAAVFIIVLASRSILARCGAHEPGPWPPTSRLPNAVQRVLDTPLGDDVVVPEVSRSRTARDEVADVAAA